jgi:hypothetical protein
LVDFYRKNDRIKEEASEIANQLADKDEYNAMLMGVQHFNWFDSYWKHYDQEFERLKDGSLHDVLPEV